MSWKPEVIADNSGKWCGNQLRFATREEAAQNVYDLSMRWLMVSTRWLNCWFTISNRWFIWRNSLRSSSSVIPPL